MTIGGLMGQTVAVVLLKLLPILFEYYFDFDFDFDFLHNIYMLILKFENGNQNENIFQYLHSNVVNVV